MKLTLVIRKGKFFVFLCVLANCILWKNVFSQVGRISGMYAGVYSGWATEIKTPCVGLRFGQRVTENIVLVANTDFFFEKTETSGNLITTKNAYEATVGFDVVFGEDVFKFQPTTGLNYIYQRKKTKPFVNDTTQVSVLTKNSHHFGLMIGSSIRLDFISGINPFLQISYVFGNISQFSLIAGVLKKFELNKKKRKRR